MGRTAKSFLSGVSAAGFASEPAPLNAPITGAKGAHPHYRPHRQQDRGGGNPLFTGRPDLREGTPACPRAYSSRPTPIPDRTPR